MRNHSASWSYIALALAVAIVSSVVTAVSSYLTKLLIDTGILEGNQQVVLLTGSVLLLTFCGAQALWWMQGLVFAHVQGRSLVNIKGQLLRRVLYLSDDDDDEGAGYYLARIESDPNALLAIFIDQPIQLGTRILTMIIVLVSFFHIDWRFALCSLVFLASIVFTAAAGSRRVLALSRA